MTRSILFLVYLTTLTSFILGQSQYNLLTSSNSGLASNKVNCIIWNWPDEIWFGTSDAGISVYHKKTGWRYYNTSNTPELPSDDIRNFGLIEIDSVFEVWVATCGDGILRNREGVWTHFPASTFGPGAQTCIDDRLYIEWGSQKAFVKNDKLYQFDGNSWTVRDPLTKYPDMKLSNEFHIYGNRIILSQTIRTDHINGGNWERYTDPDSIQYFSRGLIEEHSQGGYYLSGRLADSSAGVSIRTNRGTVYKDLLPGIKNFKGIMATDDETLLNVIVGITSDNATARTWIYHGGGLGPDTFLSNIGYTNVREIMTIGKGNWLIALNSDELQSHSYASGAVYTDGVLIYNYDQIALGEFSGIFSNPSSVVSGYKDEDIINFFPNPSNGILTFHSSSNIQTLKIYSLSGQHLFTERASIIGNKVVIPHYIKSGTYVLEMSTKSETLREKLVLIR